MQKSSKTKLAALIAAAIITSMQVVSAEVIDTGLGQNLGGAVINNYSGGFQNVELGNNSATVNVNGNTLINWSTLNVGSGETLNFNGNATDIVLNTVEQGMSTFLGNVNSNVGKLIISNPNGMLFDGAKFTTAGDLLLTTKNCSGLTSDDLANFDINNLSYSKLYKTYEGANSDNNALVPIVIKNSTFEVGGEYSIYAPAISIEQSTITANTLKLVTTNGSDYLSLGYAAPVNNYGVTFLKAVSINGDVYITNPEGALSVDGSTFNGDLTVETKGNTLFNYDNTTGEKIVINGDANIKSHGQWSMLRNAEVNGNLNMSNDGGFVEIANVNVDGNANLTTTGIEKYNGQNYNHYVHVVGNTNIEGDLNIESSENVHIGGYVYDLMDLADGKLTVKGDLNVHATDGHILTVIDTYADNINYVSDNYNILTDGKATLTANTYSFSANGFIGGISDYEGVTGDARIIDIMELYKHIPEDIDGHSYLNIAGGQITMVETHNEDIAEVAQVYIQSFGDVLLTGAYTNDLNIVAPDKYIHITGPDVIADNINIGGRTDKVEVDFPQRDFTLNYTNIRDGVVTTVEADEVITYELTNEPTNGYNAGTQTADTTFLVGPGITVIEPEPEPVPPVLPEDEPERHIQYVPEDVMKAPVDTPVAFAADLDDDEEGAPIRKNVDGSVTVVRKMVAY